MDAAAAARLLGPVPPRRPPARRPSRRRRPALPPRLPRQGKSWLLLSPKGCCIIGHMLLYYRSNAVILSFFRQVMASVVAVMVMGCYIIVFCYDRRIVDRMLSPVASCPYRTIDRYIMALLLPWLLLLLLFCYYDCYHLSRHSIRTAIQHLASSTALRHFASNNTML